MAATLDQISEGRVVLGLGAGWQRNEHAAYGLELAEPRERLDAFDESVEVISSLLRRSRTTFAGTYHQLADATCEPKPVQSPLPLLIGGGGERRTMRIAATYANIWHSWETSTEFARKNEVLDEHCRVLGRDPRTVARATGGTIAFDGPDIGNDSFNDNDIAGTADEIVECLQHFANARADEFIVRDHSGRMSSAATIEAIERLTSEVIPAFA